MIKKVSNVFVDGTQWLKTQWMLANLMIIVVSLYHFGYSLLMICMVSWSNVTSFLNESLVAPKTLFKKKLCETTKKNLFYRKCEIMRLTHFQNWIFRELSSTKTSYIKTKQQREIVCVSKTIFMPLCTSEKSVSDVSLFFCKIDYFTFLCERNIDKV